jgi:hypothetical protein
MITLERMGRTEIIHGDRRRASRYQFELELRFTYELRGTPHFGTGRTEDLSRGAIRFMSENPPPDGALVELRIAWPFLLQNVCPLELVVRGPVATRERGTILTMKNYEFRTCGQRSFDQASAGTGGSSIMA